MSDPVVSVETGWADLLGAAGASPWVDVEWRPRAPWLPARGPAAAVAFLSGSSRFAFRAGRGRWYWLAGSRASVGIRPSTESIVEPDRARRALGDLGRLLGAVACEAGADRVLLASETGPYPDWRRDEGPLAPRGRRFRGITAPREWLPWLAPGAPSRDVDETHGTVPFPDASPDPVAALLARPPAWLRSAPEPRTVGRGRWWWVLGPDGAAVPPSGWVPALRRGAGDP